jgi:hypothetical protein
MNRLVIKHLLRPIFELLGLRLKTVIKESDLNKSKTLIISFTGGMGAQIFSAAILFHLKSKGYSVKADLDYFKKDRHIATVGNKEEISHWDWQLDDYGLTIEAIKNFGEQVNRKLVDTCYLPDGHLKTQLALEALKQPYVKKQFKMPNIGKLLISFPELNLLYASHKPYILIHLRRGDYMNVLSHMLSDDRCVEFAEKLKYLLNTAVIVSDSILKSKFKRQIMKQFKQVIFLDGGTVGPFLTHCIMRNSNIIVCSHSQYSLSAAALNDGLVIIPKITLESLQLQHKAEIDKISDFVVFR